MILDIKNIESIKEGDLESLPGKTLLRRFGRADDSIELSIFDEDRRLLINDEQFNEYTPYISPQDNLTDSIDIDYEEVLRNYEPRANLSSIQINEQMDRNAIDVVVNFYVLNLPTPVSVTTTLQRIR